MTLTKPLLLAALTAVAGIAGPITFTESITTSGSLDGTTFTSQLVTIALTGDTSSITNPGSGLYRLTGSASVTVATVGSDTFTDTMHAFDNQSATAAGISDDTLHADVLDTVNSQFASYALNTSIGPLSGTSIGNSGTIFNTSGGTFSMDGPFNVDHPSTFTATTGVPEPGTVAMLGAGIGLLALGRRMIR